MVWCQIAEYALLVEDEFAAAERRRTIGSGAACDPHLFAWGERSLQIVVDGVDGALPARCG
jgi:hypothetical protein